MTEENREVGGGESSASDLSRRDFVGWSVAAGPGVKPVPTDAAELPIMEINVDVTTADGVCDAMFIHPTTGSHPGVLIWPDAFGLRPAMRDIGKRIAAEGYSVLVPNPFYRTTKAPVIADVSSFNFQNPEDRKKLEGLTGPLNAARSEER